MDKVRSRAAASFRQATKHDRAALGRQAWHVEDTDVEVRIMTIYRAYIALTFDKPLSIGWAQSQKQNPAERSFLDLPKELRNMIYEFAFRVPGAIFIFTSDAYAWRPAVKGKIVKYKNEGPSEPQRVDSVIPASLLKTCRQIYAEGAEVLYGKNVFRLYMSSVDFVPTSCHLVRHITFTMATEVLKCLRHYPIIQEIINVFLQYAQTCIVS